MDTDTARSHSTHDAQDRNSIRTGGGRRAESRNVRTRPRRGEARATPQRHEHPVCKHCLYRDDASTGASAHPGPHCTALIELLMARRAPRN